MPSRLGSATDATVGEGVLRMAFRSILYEDDENAASRAPQNAPEYFRDLNLDQTVEAITAGKEDYDLKPFFHDPLRTPEAVSYRQEVMRDLEDEQTFGCIVSFAGSMRMMRQKLAQASKLYHRYHKERWFLDAVETWCKAVCDLHKDLSRLEVSSRGLLGLRDYVADYARSERLVSLQTAAHKLASDLATVRYCVLIRGDGFTVRRYDAEKDYSAEVTETFRKFQQRSVKDYRGKFDSWVEMNTIEEKILDFVALLNPEFFLRLDEFCSKNEGYADATLTTFDREVHFYTAYIDYTRPLKRAGLNFCYPRVSATSKEVYDQEGFDLALATKLVAAETPVVCNDFSLTGEERIFVVSGPNQGGKTTFARTFGQLHHLASLGCPVPGRRAQLFLFDAMFTHFEREENIESLHGKLQDDLIRIHNILERATPRSIVIMNEIFTSTALKDAIFLARKVIKKIVEFDLLCVCVCVTFLDELASLSTKTVIMVSTVVPDNPALRTYKVVRRPADGRSYAISIAEKYRLTYEGVKARIPPERGTAPSEADGQLTTAQPSLTASEYTAAAAE